MAKYKTAEEYVDQKYGGHAYVAANFSVGALIDTFNEGRESAQPDTSKAHPHFELIERFYREFGEWDCECLDDGINEWDKVSNPAWFVDIEYRLVPAKPKMMRLGDKTFPAPETEPLQDNQTYFVPSRKSKPKYEVLTWRDDEKDDYLLEDEKIHLTKEAAISHAEAMLAMEPVPPGEDE